MDNALLVEHAGALTVLTLNRPHVLNALNDAMRAGIQSELRRASRDPETYALAIRSSSERAFCAGGDVRELTALQRQSPALAATSVANEYYMNWSLECFTKPTVALMDGLVMGSGAGLMLYGTHRVAGDGFRFAMPETAIGLFPDVGVCSVLAQLPGAVGTFLGLTGRPIGCPAAYRLGLVTHCVRAARFPEIIAGLGTAEPIDSLIDALHEAPSPELDAGDDLMAHADLIEDVFGRPTVAEIFSRLRETAATAAAGAEWCAALLDGLERYSPLSLVITLRHLRECRGLNLRDVLIRDYRLALRFLVGKDFPEGVRALLIDKDGNPNWAHPSVKDIEIKEIEEYFASLEKNELDLPGRSKMQEIQG